MEGTRFRIDLVPIHVMSDYEYIKEHENGIKKYEYN